MQVLLAHEMPGADDATARHAVRFDTFFAGEASGGTPEALVGAGIYHRIATPLKGGAWREVSMILLAQAIAKGVDGPGQETRSSETLGHTRPIRRASFIRPPPLSVISPLSTAAEGGSVTSTPTSDGRRTARRLGSPGRASFAALRRFSAPPELHFWPLRSRTGADEIPLSEIAGGSTGSMPTSEVAPQVRHERAYSGQSVERSSRRYEAMSSMRD